MVLSALLALLTLLALSAISSLAACSRSSQSQFAGIPGASSALWMFHCLFLLCAVFPWNLDELFAPFECWILDLDLSFAILTRQVGSVPPSQAAGLFLFVGVPAHLSPGVGLPLVFQFFGRAMTSVLARSQVFELNKSRVICTHGQDPLGCFVTRCPSFPAKSLARATLAVIGRSSCSSTCAGCSHFLLLGL